MRRVRLVVAVALGLALAPGVIPPALGQPAQPGVPAPDLTGGPWINSAPLTLTALRGRVVLVEFWTYG
jgi:hypothetical protein